MGAQYGWPQFVLSETVNAFTQLQASLANTQGIEIGIADYGGFRSIGDTEDILADRSSDFDAAVNDGEIPASTDINAWRPVAPYGHSFHNYGAAFDIRIKDGGLPAGMDEATAFSIAGGLASSLGLRWGGSFANPDPDHFELDVSLSQARSMFSSEFAAMGSIVAGDVSQFDTSGLDPNTAGDDSGEGTLELELAQRDQIIAYVVAGLAVAALLAVFATSRQ